MAELILKPNPTFRKDVPLPVPGAEPMRVTFEFRHMTRKALAEFLHGEESEKRSDLDALMKVIADWPGQSVAFSRENLAELLENYHGAGRAIMQTYIDELQAVRLGN